jgi:glycerate kinase
MKIIIAPDSYKGSLTSMEVARAVEKGIRRVLPKARCTSVPMADGGEGTVQSLVDATGGRFIRKRVKGPAGKPVTARYGMLADGETAVIEMAEASGLPLVSGRSRNPLRTTTFGTGQLMVDAMNKGARRIIIGIGGSATTDGGAGMAQALGVRFRDRRGNIIRGAAAGGMLDRIAGIDMSGRHEAVERTTITVACDVDNPLYGKRGAAHVFGPQKGATPAAVKKLDANLRHFGDVIKRSLGRDVAKLKGAGAAGGLGAGLMAFAGAELRSGIDIVVEAVRLERHVKTADLVITGEGQVDFQTAYGKTPAGVARVARRYKVPVVAIGGGLADDARDVFKHGIDGIEAAVARPMTLDEAVDSSKDMIANAAERVMRLIVIGGEMAEK